MAMLRTSMISRADLLAVLQSGGKEALPEAAGFFGYFPKAPEKENKQPQNLTGLEGRAEVQTEVEHQFSASGFQPEFWHVADYRPVKARDLKTKAPDWTRGPDVFKPGEIGARPDKKGLVHVPLVKNSRLWPILKSILGLLTDARRLDVDAAVRIAARFEPLVNLPKKKKLIWNQTACLILDYHEELLPFWADLHKLTEWIRKLRGKSGLSIHIALQEPPGRFRKPGLNQAGYYPFRMPEPGTPLLIVSDLGRFDPSKTRLKSWDRFLKRLKQRGLAPVVLTPCPSYLWDMDLMSWCTLIPWDRGVRLPRPDRKNRIPALRPAKPLPDIEKKIARLLTLLSCAIRVEPELLRAVRVSLPVREADAYIEAGVWNHPDLYPCPIALSFREAKAQGYRAAFPGLEEKEKKMAVALRNQCHQILSKAVQSEEELISNLLLDPDPGSNAADFIRKFFRTADHGRVESREEMKAWVNRMALRIEGRVWQENSEILTPAWMLFNREEWKEGTRALPGGADPAHAAWLIGPEKKVFQLEMVQTGHDLFLLNPENRTSILSPKGFSLGSPILSLQAGRYLDIDGRRENPEEIIKIPLPEKETITITSDFGRAVLDRLTKPDLAEAIGRDGRGLFISFPGSDQRIYHPWGKLGKDQYGIFTEYEIQGVIFRMRWIKPGRFMMGAPEDEAEREEDEVLHEVILTRGFWLGETACTQALWEAVTGENPSRFKDRDRPVERVSWNDCTAFIESLNRLLPGLEMRLPTEAEWEYACRSGTRSPFSFGDAITSDEVNFDGDYPYKGKKKSKYREETVPVKSLPCNAWGLYEMHGNVWEWCSDWYEAYDLKNTTDPKGPDKGGRRVLRGGSWIILGGRCRSAARDHGGPGDADYDTGFRLAQGH